MQEPGLGSFALRRQALQRLPAFVPHVGITYAAKRNEGVGSGQHRFVSGLSPTIRHRLISEEKVVTAVQPPHAHAAADPFIKDVYWRTYWKRWLEQRPRVWTGALSDVVYARARLSADDAIAAELAPYVRVNAIARILTMTRLAMGPTRSEAMADGISVPHPIPRHGHAEDIAALAPFLLSAEAGCITGQIIGVDGGRLTSRVGKAGAWS